MTDNVVRLAEVLDNLAQYAPLELAEEWDNVGLLVGDAERSVARVMTCLIVTHHPLPFRTLKRITTETTPGKMLLALLGERIAIYSPHTAFDSARFGINQRLAEGLQLEKIGSLIENSASSELPGSGRCGELPGRGTLAGMATRLKEFLNIQQLRYVGDLNTKIRTVAVACGSGGSFLDAASRAGCQMLVTGEATFHDCLAAEALGVTMLLPGHYASERFALECLAEHLVEEFSSLEVWASEKESDPLDTV